MSDLQLVKCTFAELHATLEASPRLRVKAIAMHHADLAEFCERVPVVDDVADRGDLKAILSGVNIYANERVGMLQRGEILASLYEAPDAGEVAAIARVFQRLADGGVR